MPKGEKVVAALDEVAMLHGRWRGSNQGFYAYV